MANKKLKVNRNRYDFGGGVGNIPADLLNHSQRQEYSSNDYMDMIANPDAQYQQGLMNYEIDKAARENSGWSKALGTIGNLAVNAGTGIMTQGIADKIAGIGAKAAGAAKDAAANTAIKSTGGASGVDAIKTGANLSKPKRDYTELKKGLATFGMNLGANALRMLPSLFAQGGVAGEEDNIQHVPIEAEGGEMIAMPWDNQAMHIEGASHENGGVDMTVPVGSKIYSKRVKDAKGVSMAKRKERRDRELKKWEKIVNDDPNNKIAKDTLEKVRRNNEIEESNDMAYMQLHKAKKQFSDYIKSVTKDYGKGGGLNIAMARQASDDVHTMFGVQEVNEQGVPKYAEGAEVSSSISQRNTGRYNLFKNIATEFGGIFENANSTKKNNKGDILFQSSGNANKLADYVLQVLGEDDKMPLWKKKNAIYKIVRDLALHVNKQGNFEYKVDGKRKSVVQFIKDMFGQESIFPEGTTEKQKEAAYGRFITLMNNIKGHNGVLDEISNSAGKKELMPYIPKNQNITHTVFDNIGGNTKFTVNPPDTSVAGQTVTTDIPDTNNILSAGKGLPSLDELSKTKPSSLTKPVSLTEKIGSKSNMDLGIIPDLSNLTPDQFEQVIKKIEAGDSKTPLTNPNYAEDWATQFFAKHPLPESANNYITNNTTIKGKDNTKGKESKLGKLFDVLSDNLNSGNALQLAGIIHNMRKPMQAVLDNFRGKAQYRNFYRDYGKKSLLELDQMKDNIRQIRDENLRDLSDRQAAMVYSNNNSARDINVARAMNLATLSQITDAANKAYANYASMNNDVHKLRANALTDIDNKVMGEDKWADQMNREMRDSFFANKLEAQKAVGMGLQQIGKLFNKERYIRELRKHYEEIERERRAATANKNINLKPTRITIG